MIVTTEQGRVEGLAGADLWHFRGIPYAAPPVGERRFRPPEPPEGWVGVRPAIEFGAVSWQGNTGVSLLLGEKGDGPSEDCLFLNVTTPAADDRARPVLVWIHGGGFLNGSSSSSWYDPTRMVSRGDVVVVTVNYRLGALGFLWLGDLDGGFSSSGVNGLLDQTAALSWVQANIAAFGGDPGNVTIFGESAGAMSSSTLLALPAARGLFHRVIAQSGAGSNTFSPEIGAEITSSVMSRLGVTELDGLLDVEPAALVAASVKVTGEVFHEPGRIAGPTGIALAMAFQPVVDGTWLPQDPLQAIRTGAAADVPLVVGTNADEWNLFRLLSPGGLDHPELLGRLEAIFGVGHEIRDTYAAGRPDAAPDELWSAILTDATFRIPAVRLLEARVEGGMTTPSFHYLFAWPTPAFGGVVGACHALEVPFVFGTLGSSQAELVLGGSTGPELWSLSDAVQDAWLAFARTGSPSRRGAVLWPEWDPEARSVMRFDTTLEVLSDPAAAERLLWDGVV